MSGGESQAVPMDLSGTPSTMVPMDGATATAATRRTWFVRDPFVVVGIAFVCLVITGMVWSSLGGSGSASTAVTSTVETVTRGSMSETVSADGTVEAAKTDDLSFGSSGKVTAVNVKAGDTVKAGQVLATIDPTDLESSVAAAESTVADAAAQVADDKSSGASSEQLAADETSLISAYDSLTSAKDALAGASLIATFDGTVAQVKVTAGEQLAGGTGGTSATGSGSGSGTSSSSLGSGGTTGIPGAASSSSSTSASSDPHVQVVSKGSYEVTLNVGSDDVDSVEVGQVATLTVSKASSSSSGGFPGFPGGGFPGRGGSQNQTGGAGGGSSAGGASQRTQQSSAPSATGKVIEVARVADASSGVAQYPVKIAFTASATEFYVGSNVTGSIETKTRDNVLQVPVRAVTTSNGKSTVEVAVDGTVDGKTETRTVKTGLTSGGNIEIKSGLKAGEKVVIPGIGGFPGGGAGGGFPSGGIPSGGFPSGSIPSGGFPTQGGTGQ